MLADKEFGMLTINGIPIGPIFGGTQPVRQEGMLTSGDLVTVTSDGIDLNALWNSFAESISIYNEAMDDLIELLTYPVTTPIEPVVQIGELTFEEASEIGVPRGAGLPIEVFQMGYDLRHYDKRNVFTWMFLADADARQVEAIHEAVLWLTSVLSSARFLRLCSTTGLVVPTFVPRRTAFTRCITVTVLPRRASRTTRSMRATITT